MPKDKNNNREMTPDEKFRSFFSTTAVDIPEAMTRRDEEEPEEKPQKRLGLFGRSKAKQQAGQPADLPLEMPTGEVLLGGAAEPEPEADLELVLKPTADPELLPFREEPQTEAGGKTQEKKPEPVPAAPQPEPPREEVPPALLTPDLIALGVPEKLAPLMSANNVTPEELQHVVGERGYFPEDMPIKDYPMDFVEGCLIAAWPEVLQKVLDGRDLPF